MKITDSISINAPLSKVFDVFTDLNKATERVGGITKIEILEGSAKMKKGTKWRETRVLFGKEATEVMWVTQLNANKSYVVEARSHGADYRSEYTFKQDGESVIVSTVFEGKPNKLSGRLMSVMNFLFKGATKKALHKDLVDLKKASEKK